MGVEANCLGAPLRVSVSRIHLTPAVSTQAKLGSKTIYRIDLRKTFCTSIHGTILSTMPLGSYSFPKVTFYVCTEPYARQSSAQTQPKRYPDHTSP